MKSIRFLLAFTALCCVHATSAQLSKLELSGDMSVTVRPDSVYLSVGRITNDSKDGTSGSLKLAVYLSDRPYTGGTISGTKIFEQEIPPIKGGYHRKDSRLGGKWLNLVPDGTYVTVIVLLEFDAEDNRYYIVDSFTLDNRIEIGYNGWVSLKNIIKEHDVVLVPFYQEGCSSCNSLHSNVESIADKYGEKVKIATVNVDEFRELCSLLNVRTVPHYQIYKAGKLSWEQSGPIALEIIERELDR